MYSNIALLEVADLLEISNLVEKEYWVYMLCTWIAKKREDLKNSLKALGNIPYILSITIECRSKNFDIVILHLLFDNSNTI